MPLSNIRPADYDSLLAAKVERVTALFAPHAAPTPLVFPSPPTGFRQRAEFRVWHEGDNLDYVMFRRDDPKTPVAVHDFVIASPLIQAAMPELISRLRNNDCLRRKLFQVEFLATLSGELLITLLYHRKLEEDWQLQAQGLRDELEQGGLPCSLIGRSRKQKLVLGDSFVTETLTINGVAYHYRQYEQAFSQPNAQVNTAMIGWACEAAQSLSGDLLELYCGNGNFTLPLSTCFERVLATELSKVSVRAARHNIDTMGAANIQIARLSAEEMSQAMAGTRVFRRLAELETSLADYRLDTLFVDPPRAGLDDHTVSMAAGFENILYISCNPDTLASNLDTLVATHRVERLALFDQFPYTDHMECGVLLRRRDSVH